MNENLVWSSEGRLGKLLFSTEKAPSWRVLLLGADFIAKLGPEAKGRSHGGYCVYNYRHSSSDF